MFDTIQAKYQVRLDESQFQQLQRQYDVKIINKIDTETGEIYFQATMRDHKIHFFNYFSNSQLLYFDVSIPEYLLGGNHKEINEQHIEPFYNRLKEDFYKLFSIQLDINDVKIKSLDVCHNLDIAGTGFNMAEWLLFISQQQIPRKPHKSVYYYQANVNGVVFKANAKSSDRLTFYDKEAEMKDNKKKRMKSHEAKNLLRVEVKTSDYERSSFGDHMVDLLNINFFLHIMEKYKINQLLKRKYEEQQTEIPYAWLIDELKFKVYQLEKLVGHMTITKEIPDLAPSLYEAKTYKSRQQELNEFNRLIEQQPINRKILEVEI